MSNKPLNQDNLISFNEDESDYWIIKDTNKLGYLIEKDTKIYFMFKGKICQEERKELEINRHKYGGNGKIRNKIVRYYKKKNLFL